MEKVQKIVEKHSSDIGKEVAKRLGLTKPEDFLNLKKDMDALATTSLKTVHHQAPQTFGKGGESHQGGEGRANRNEE